VDGSLRLDDDAETLGSRTPLDGSTLLDAILGEFDPEIGGVIASQDRSSNGLGDE
jgi:hypothetical protein